MIHKPFCFKTAEILMCYTLGLSNNSTHCILGCQKNPQIPLGLSKNFDHRYAWSVADLLAGPGRLKPKTLKTKKGEEKTWNGHLFALWQIQRWATLFKKKLDWGPYYLLLDVPVVHNWLFKFHLTHTRLHSVGDFPRKPISFCSSLETFWPKK